jgi:hypothetical protein
MKSFRNIVFCLAASAALAIFLTAPGFAQSAPSDSSNEALLKRVQELERTLAELKAQLPPASTASVPAPPAPEVAANASVPAAPVAEPAPAAPVPPAAPAPAPASQGDASEGHTLGPLQFRGFSDFTFGRPFSDQLPQTGLAGSRQSFTLGDFDLFVTSQISSKFNFLAEMLVTSDFSNETGAELDRIMMTYTANDYLKITAGKFNTAIGYYTNAFHRARFFQTATDRPQLFADEDSGGILPVHSVGVSFSGKIPSGSLGLHWVAEVSNGENFKERPNGVANFVDVNNGKAYNVALYARPVAIQGLQIGGSFYHDRITPFQADQLNQRIYSAYAALVRMHVEAIGEGILLQHTSLDGRETYKTYAGYAQLSRAFGRIRPYFRYEFQNVPANDPVYGFLGRQNGPSVGTRLDLGDYVALKLQVGRLFNNYGTTSNTAQVQLAFAF